MATSAVALVSLWRLVAVLCMLMGAGHGASAQGFSNEVDALVAFKNSVQDPEQALESWDPTSADPCTWFHITCDGNSRVQRVELFGNHLTGSVPGELGQLSSLIALHLQENALTGSIPPQLTSLSQLQFL
ncbi:hypothetical protein L7F22_018048 [Adiantum nelumboides]|nr:hypothetical protein [Adiantum nelumboides]